MKKAANFTEYIETVRSGKDMVLLLRDILLSSGLTETIKWGQPVYTVDGRNVVGLGSFNSYTGLWFFQGALLKDTHGALINPQEGITKAQRQWRFNNIEEINPPLVLDYIREAAANMKAGKVVKPAKNSTFETSPELTEALERDKPLKSIFSSLAPFKQKEYHQYINQAKMEETKQQRIKRCLPLIREGTGLNDRYRK